jgi:hypothetical protein
MRFERLGCLLTQSRDHLGGRKNLVYEAHPPPALIGNTE